MFAIFSKDNKIETSEQFNISIEQFKFYEKPKTSMKV